MFKMSKFSILMCLVFFVISSEAQTVQEVISLDGEWEIIFDYGNNGRDLGLQDAETFANYIPKRNIKVPSSWELLEQDYEGVAWYGKTIEIKQEWKGKSVRLCFDASNYRTEVWVNGLPAGQHEGGYTGFELEIGNLLHFEKENFVAVRIIGPIVRKNITIDGLGRLDMPHWRGALTGGIWQSVYLKVNEPCYVDDIFVESLLDKQAARIHYRLNNNLKASKNLKVVVAVFEKDNLDSPLTSYEEKKELKPGTSNGEIELKIDNPKLWSVEDPNLYVAKITLEENDAIVNQKKVRFGMRHFEVKNDDFYLNGEKIILRSGFWEGLYPLTLAAPPNADYVRKEIELAKEMGFNMLRPWRRQCPKPVLDLADEMGLLIIASPAIECMGQWPSESPRMEERIFNEFEEMVLRDRNHPSVICWELYNEIHRHSIGRLKHKTAVFVRKLDPTRLIIDESGGWVGGAHAYNPGSLESIDINEIHSYQRAPVNNLIYDNFVHLGKTDDEFKKLGLHQIGHTKSKVIPNKLIFISEIGYGGFPDLDSTTARLQKEGNPLSPIYRYHHRMKNDLSSCIDEMEIRSIYPTVSSFCQASQTIQANGNKLQLESALLNDKLDAYCLHAFTGGDWIVGAGILDIFRSKKKTFETIKEVNQPQYLPVRTNKSSYFSGENVEYKVHAINNVETGKYQFLLEILDENGAVVHKDGKEVQITSSIQDVDMGTWKTDKEGNYSLMVKLKKADETVSVNSYSITIFPETEITGKKDIVYYDESAKLKNTFKSMKFKATQFSAKTKTGALVLVGNVHNQEIIGKLKQHAQNGGIVVFLKPPLDKLFDEPLKTDGAYGNWVPVNRVVKESPVFAGLPQNTMMDQLYQNVIPNQMILNMPDGQEVLVGAVTWDWHKNNRFKQNYTGPGETYWGTTYSELPYGKGKIVVSMLKILENIEMDPVADMLLVNMINNY